MRHRSKVHLPSKNSKRTWPAWIIKCWRSATLLNKQKEHVTVGNGTRFRKGFCLTKCWRRTQEKRPGKASWTYEFSDKRHCLTRSLICTKPGSNNVLKTKLAAGYWWASRVQAVTVGPTRYLRVPSLSDWEPTVKKLSGLRRTRMCISSIE